MTDDLRRRQIRAIRDQILFHVDLHDVAHQVVERCRQQGTELRRLQIDPTDDGRGYVIVAEIGAGNWQAVGSARRIVDMDGAEVERRLWAAIVDAGDDE